jgi:hypothetical protein
MAKYEGEIVILCHNRALYGSPVWVWKQGIHNYVDLHYIVYICYNISTTKWSECFALANYSYVEFMLWDSQMNSIVGKFYVIAH